MVINWKPKVNLVNWQLYCILIPFLCPRGFFEYSSAYKAFFTAWLYVSLCYVAIRFVYLSVVRKNRYHKCILTMIMYFVIFLLITVMQQGGITEGLQKMIVAPVLCLMCAMYLREWPLNFLKVVAVILIVNFSLNIMVFHPAFWENYFTVDGHILFLGHVQIIAQLGILGIFVAHLCKKMGCHALSKILSMMAVLNMLFSETAASYVSLLGILLLYTLRKSFKKLMAARWLPAIILAGTGILNCVLFGVSKYYVSGMMLNTIMASVTSGRNYVWREIFNLMEGHWLSGYGAYGVLIRVFWHGDASGMNYAHNEILQRLLDGGLILLVLFVAMLFAYSRNIAKCSDEKTRYHAYACLIVFLVVMLFESVTEYYYFFILLTIFAYLPWIITKILDKRN